MVLDLFFSIIGILLLLVLIYLFVLAVAAMIPEEKQEFREPAMKFLVVIPAHNEAQTIGHSLACMRHLRYPKRLWDVTVIADNCTDNTAEIVRGLGVQCLERWAPEDMGKGSALSWGFKHLIPKVDHDAFVIIDADTIMDKDFLSSMNNRLLQGVKVIQAYSQVRHPDRSPLEGLAFLGFALNRNLRYLGRSKLGLQANLMGTGMCFAREIIETYGWPAHSKVEDLEFTMFLKMQAVRVVFAPEARVTVELHENVEDSRGQRLRWDMGKFQVRDRYLPMLFRRLWATRDLSYLDSIMELLLPPFSLFFLMVWVLFLLYLLLDFRGFNMVFYIWSSVLLALMIYTVLGLISARAGARVYGSLFYAPFFIVWRWWILLVEHLRRDRRDSW